MSAKHILYRHFDREGNLLYVGRTQRFRNRVREHKTSKWFDKVNTITLEHFPNREALKKAEAAAIRSECPIFNKHHNVVKKAVKEVVKNHVSEVVKNSEPKPLMGISISKVKPGSKRWSNEWLSSLELATRYAVDHRRIESWLDSDSFHPFFPEPYTVWNDGTLLWRMIDIQTYEDHNAIIQGHAPYYGVSGGRNPYEAG